MGTNKPRPDEDLPTEVTEISDPHRVIPGLFQDRTIELDSEGNRLVTATRDILNHIHDHPEEYDTEIINMLRTLTGQLAKGESVTAFGYWPSDADKRLTERGVINLQLRGAVQSTRQRIHLASEKATFAVDSPNSLTKKENEALKAFLKDVSERYSNNFITKFARPAIVKLLKSDYPPQAEEVFPIK